ncbi:unnamed protein product [Orchesella dallaii]|uniref:Uncharacterized protein n=1 Tax=Orchesella dallaii TaxID=48710 RepID=A0ABP1PUV2_9HEXA
MAILGCRVANRASKRAVDELLTENFGCWRKRQPVTTKMESMIRRIRAQHYVFGSEEIISDFFLHMGQRQYHPNDNPFMKDSISPVLWDSIEYLQDEVLATFLSRFGNYGKNVVFDDGNYALRRPTLQKLIWILAYLPNLKSLTMSDGGIIGTGLEGFLDVAYVPPLESFQELSFEPLPQSITVALEFLRRWKLSMTAVTVGFSNQKLLQPICFLTARFTLSALKCLRSAELVFVS